MKAETTTVLLPKTVYEAAADKDIELENTLADYLPNINRILRADADVFCGDVEISDGKVEVNGKAVFSLLYESDFKQKLQCERFEAEFTHKFDLKDVPDDELFPVVHAKCSYVGCKTLNPRKFLLRCRVDLGLEVKCMQGAQIVSLQTGNGAYFKSEKRRLAVYTPAIVRDFTLEESIPLETAPPVGDIIYSCLAFASGEAAVSEGSALIRAEATFKCLYEREDEDGGLYLAQRRFPVAVTVDDECILPDSDVNFTLCAKNIETDKDIDTYGENRVIKLNYSLRAVVTCVNREEVEIPTDMFFEDYETENLCQVLVCEEPSKELRHRFTLEKTFELPDSTLESCLDVNAEAVVTETAAAEDGISVKGSVGISVFGPCADGYRSHDLQAAVSAVMPFPVSGDCRFKVRAEVQNPAAEASGGRITVRIPIELCAVVVRKESFPALVSSNIENRSDEDAGTRPVVIYYPQKGEAVWDIGKRYYVNPDEVAENNPDAFDKSGLVAADGVVLYM